MRLRRITVVAVLAVLVSLGSVAQAQNHAQHYVLDAFGGVHAGGGAPVITPATPYFGFDAARSVVRRDVPSRIGWSTLTPDVFFDTATTSFTTLTTATITAPVTSRGAPPFFVSNWWDPVTTSSPGSAWVWMRRAEPPEDSKEPQPGTLATVWLLSLNRGPKP